MKTLQLLKQFHAIRRESLASFASPKTWKRIQRKRLEELVQIAAQRSPFYREKYKGLNLSSITMDSLPTVTKAELLDSPHIHWTVPDISKTELTDYLSDVDNVGTWFQGKYCVFQTSGTQGRSLTILHDRQAMSKVFAIMAARSRSQRRPTLREAIERLREPKRLAVVTHRQGFFPSRAAMSLLPGLYGRLIRIQHFSSMQEDLVDAIQEFQPHGIFGYASVLDRIAGKASHLEWKSLQSVSNSSEQLIDSARDRVESAFRVKVLDHYGAGECLQIADSCEHGNMHVNADWVIVEPVDDQLQSVPEGQPGKRLLITNLVNQTCPFIRYVLEDQLQLIDGRECECGCSFPIIKSFLGRSYERIVVSNDREVELLLPGVMFHTAFENLTFCTEWRVRQLAIDRLCIDVQSSEGTTASQSNNPDLKKTVQEELYRQGVPRWVTIDIQWADHIPPDPVSGKFKRFVSLTK